MWPETKSYFVNQIVREKLAITIIINKIVLGEDLWRILEMIAVPITSPVPRFRFHIGDVS